MNMHTTIPPAGRRFLAAVLAPIGEAAEPADTKQFRALLRHSAARAYGARMIAAEAAWHQWQAIGNAETALAWALDDFRGGRDNTTIAQAQALFIASADEAMRTPAPTKTDISRKRRLLRLAARTKNAEWLALIAADEARLGAGK